MKTTAATIHFDSPLVKIGDFVVAQIPEVESVKLPSRGQIFVKGTINDHPFEKVLEPDGRWSHWFKIDEKLQQQLGVEIGDTVTVEITPSKDWPDPELPKDFALALDSAPQKVKDKWKDITAMARWEWIRWVNATSSSDTRAIRIEKSMSKLNGTHRRPCCFNLAACTDPDLSKSGRLMEPVHAA